MFPTHSSAAEMAELWVNLFQRTSVQILLVDALSFLIIIFSESQLENLTLICGDVVPKVKMMS